MQGATRRAGCRAPGTCTRSGTHTAHTSHVAMRGAPAKAIKELAGHQSLTTTLRYMHLSPAVKDAAVRLLDPRHTGEVPEAVGGELGENAKAGSAEALGK